jgi:hypothetical protein
MDKEKLGFSFSKRKAIEEEVTVKMGELEKESGYLLSSNVFNTIAILEMLGYINREEQQSHGLVFCSNCKSSVMVRRENRCWVFCPSCGKEGPHLKNEADAVTWWNTINK